MTRTRMAGLALLLAALLLAGCGGSGGGEPTVTQTVHDELQAELAAALADLTKEREAKAEEKTARTTAETEVTRLKGTIGSADDEADAGGSLYAQLNAANAEATRLTGELGTATGNVTRLEGEIGAATDTANADGSLHAQINAAKAEATRLETLIGTATDAADATGSLYAQLNAAKADVTRLEGVIGAATDTANAAANASLHAQLNAAKARASSLETLIGDPITPAVDSLRGQLAAANAKVTSASGLQAELTTAKAEVTRLKGELQTANSTVTTLRTQLATAQAAVTTATRRATEATAQVTEVERQGDVNARGRGVLTLLKTFDGSGWGTAGDPATVRINDRNTAIEIVASPLTGSTRTSGKFHTATLMRTAPGVNQPERKTVVYTDREKSRTFANHYASSIVAPATVGGTKANPRFQHSTWAPASLSLLTSASKALVKTASRGGHDATIAASDPVPDRKFVSTFPASVHGVPGHYGCYNSSANKACRIAVAAAYTTGTEATDPQQLTGLTISPETIVDETTNLYFDPGGGSIALLDAPAKEGVPKTTDAEFITFGWWRETPAKPDALGEYAYEAAVFASVPDGETFADSGGTGKAEYEGPAVGLYVDLKSEGDKTIYESGDFTATTILRATFGSATGAGVEGDVTAFKTTHGAKNWHVRLNNDVGKTAEIVQGSADSSGTWVHTSLMRHDNVGTADNQPIAMTGRFVASIPNVRHIVGAFGAHRTTDPLEAAE